jgi:hypothetical protein
MFIALFSNTIKIEPIKHNIKRNLVLFHNFVLFKNKLINISTGRIRFIIERTKSSQFVVINM